MTQFFQQGCAAGRHVVPGGLEIPGVPGVGHVPADARVIQQQTDFPVGITAEEALHIPQVGAVHADEQVIPAIIGPGQLPGRLAGAGNAVLGQNPPRRRIDRVPQLLSAGSGGRNLKRSLQSGFCYQILHHKLGHRASANIAVANKKYTKTHILPTFTCKIATFCTVLRKLAFRSTAPTFTHFLAYGKMRQISARNRSQNVVKIAIIDYWSFDSCFLSFYHIRQYHATEKTC